MWCTSLLSERQKTPLISWVIAQRTDSTHWLSFFLILLLQLFSLSCNEENVFSGGPLTQPEAFLRDPRCLDAWALSNFWYLKPRRKSCPVLSFLEVINSLLLEMVCFLMRLQLPRAPLLPSAYLFWVNHAITHWVTSKKEDRKRRLEEIRLLRGVQVKKACPE